MHMLCMFAILCITRSFATHFCFLTIRQFTSSTSDARFVLQYTIYRMPNTAQDEMDRLILCIVGLNLCCLRVNKTFFNTLKADGAAKNFTADDNILIEFVHIIHRLVFEFEFISENNWSILAS